MTGAKLLGMHETVTSPKEYRSHHGFSRGDAGVVEGSYADDAKGVTPGQYRSFRVAVAYRGYAGDGWRVTSRGSNVTRPKPQPPDWVPAHRTVAGRHPGGNPTVDMQRPRCRAGGGTAPVTLACPQATGNVRPEIAVASWPAPPRGLDLALAAEFVPATGTPPGRLRSIFWRRASTIR